jgi:integrase
MENQNASKILENESPQSETIIIGGRKERITTDDVLKAIRHYLTTSPSELAEKLECARMTVYRKMQEIPQDQIDQIFKDLAESELKPFEMEWETFRQLPEMQELDVSLSRAQVSPAYKQEMQRCVFSVCKYLKKRPKSLDQNSVDLLADTWLQLKQKKIKIEGCNNEEMFRKAIRVLFLYRGISGKILTAKGITGEHGEGYGKRALDKITIQEREEFLKTLREQLISEGLEKEIAIWESLVYWLFHTGTRITASSQVRIEEINWTGDTNDIQTIGKILVVDKGRHKKGRQKWRKLIVGSLKMKIIANLQSRGNPKEGLLFNGITPDKSADRFNAVYKIMGLKVHQANHIWRHTASQELLDATDWNYEIVGSILGWSNTNILKECYGKMGESIRERALKKAMGIPIKEETKLFQFTRDDQPLIPSQLSLSTS